MTDDRAREILACCTAGCLREAHDPPCSDGWIELRPDSKGEFDEVVATFPDGSSAHIETLDGKRVFMSINHANGESFAVWISANSKLRYSHERRPV